MSTLPQKAPGSLSQAYQLLALVALSGELPASQLSRLAGGTSYKENVVKSLKRQRLLLSYYKNGLRGYRLTAAAKKLLLERDPERFSFYPASAVKPPRNLTQTHRDAPPPEQIELIKKGAGLPFGLFACLIYYTGCRRGEALALTGADIDRKKNLVHIKKSVYHVGNSPHIKQPKSDAGCRDVPLLPALAHLLPQKLGKSYLFAEPDGGLLTNDHYTALYDAYRDASGVTVTPHQIRHGYATALLESGVDPKTAQVLLGHAQLSTTMDIYTHVRDGQLKAAAEKMEKGF